MSDQALLFKMPAGEGGGGGGGEGVGLCGPA